MYLEPIPRQRGLSIVDPLASPNEGLTANKRSQSGLSGYATPDTFPTPPSSPPKPEEQDYLSLEREEEEEEVEGVNKGEEEGGDDTQPTVFTAPHTTDNK